MRAVLVLLFLGLPSLVLADGQEKMSFAIAHPVAPKAQKDFPCFLDDPYPECREVRRLIEQDTDLPKGTRVMRWLEREVERLDFPCNVTTAHTSITVKLYNKNGFKKTLPEQTETTKGYAFQRSYLR
jgi:hypothetical protein